VTDDQLEVNLIQPEELVSRMGVDFGAVVVRQPFIVLNNTLLRLCLLKLTNYRLTAAGLLHKGHSLLGQIPKQAPDRLSIHYLV